jgi:acetyl-CoA carboxylase alpha subunit
MNRFAKPLSRVVQFGRALQRGAQRVGQGITNVTNKIAGGLQKAERIVGVAEKFAGGIPIIGTGIKTVGNVLGAGAGAVKTAGAVGSGLTSLAGGDIKGVRSAVMRGKEGVKMTLDEGAQGLANATKTAGQAALFL